MNIKNTLAIAIASTLFVGGVSAASLDFREEYKHGQEDFAGRVKIGGSAGNHYFGVEAKHSGHLGELERADNEFEYGYNFNLDEHWRIQMSMPVTFGSTSVTYKPQVRVQYKFDSGLVTKLRYRHEFRNYSDGNSTTGRDGEKYDFVSRSKLTGNLDYNWNDWQLGFEANYAQDLINDEWKMGTNEKYEWDYNFKIGYKESDWNWRPYIELGNVQHTAEDSRQLRSRVGITYSF